MAPSDPRAPDRDEGDDDRTALAALDFSTFVLSLASSCMVNLGKLADPEGQPPAPRTTDLPSAKQIIDILGLLEDKTRGNLDEAEQKLLRGVLYDLRVQYCDAQRAPANVVAPATAAKK
jgi:hypothetical protein